jgi:hypothetical protein
VVLNNPTVANYCENGTIGSVLVADVTLSDAIPSDITMDYTWTVSKVVSAVTSTPSLASVGGAVTSNGSLKNTFTVTTSDVGVYTFSVKTKFLSATNVPIKSGTASASCETTASATPTVTVSPKPIKPAISIL